ncbi:hypothetical protein ACHAW6_014760 [Cyclotella cf. meneghiniana]
MTIAADEAITTETDIDADESIPVKPKAAALTFEAQPFTSFDERRSGGYKRRNLIIIGTIIVISIISISIALTRRTCCAIPDEPTRTIDFTTGVSIITNYAVDSKVRSRLATTNLTMEVLNGMNCSSVHMVTLQLPLNTRVTSLKTVANDGCTTNGKVKEIQEARDTFVEQTSQGLSSAYVEAQDEFTYTVQVSIPPFGKTKVELIVEQILQQRRGMIAFEVPLIPNEEVDSLLFDLSVEDVQGNPVDFQIELHLPGIKTNATNGTNKYHLELPDARQHDLPLVVRGTYTPGQIPENGLLYFDGSCFEHYFLPPSLKPMPRNFIFVVDVSESMPHDKKLNATKIALKKFISTIDESDSFSIQTFGDKGTLDLWGPEKGTSDGKEDAKNFLDVLSNENHRHTWGTNLHEAVLEALLRAKDDIKESKNDTVSILVLVSKEWASTGETDRSKIVKNVHDLNNDGSVKIFTLGFQGSSDMALLDAISLLNGGISANILSGDLDDNFEPQITRFLESEMGSVLLSDMHVNFIVDKVRVVGTTNTYFSLMAGGYEVVVRGLVQGTLNDNPLKAEITASTLENVQNWVAVATDSPATVDSSLCYQSYAHARVSQLVRLSEAADFLGDKVLKSLVTLADPSCKEEHFVTCIEQEAVHLAIDAKIVAKGLTAMVTVDSDDCMKFDDSAPVCLDGTTSDPTAWSQERMSDGTYMRACSIFFSLFVCLMPLVAALLSI